MESAALKRKIGICYFVFTAIIFLFLNRVYVIELQRFLICCAFGFLGLGGRAFVYYGLLQETEKRELNKKQIKDDIFAYFLYYLIGLLAVISIIFVASYENLKNMNFELFCVVSLFLFSSFGFAVKEAMDKFLFIVAEKKEGGK
jgi:hypothetical protein